MVDKQAKIDLARQLFLSGHSCAQSVAAAYADEMALPRQTVLRLAGGFGGGLGGMRVTCGATMAMAMVASTLVGYDDPADLQTKQYLYALIRRMCERFTAEYETLNCRTLLTNAGIEVKNTPSERTPEYYRKRPCVRYVMACAGILADTVNEEGLA